MQHDYGQPIFLTKVLRSQKLVATTWNPNWTSNSKSTNPKIGINERKITYIWNSKEAWCFSE